VGVGCLCVCVFLCVSVSELGSASQPLHVYSKARVAQEGANMNDFTFQGGVKMCSCFERRYGWLCTY
jgi:hypothetical protein